MSTSGRRPPFRTQTLGSIFLRMLGAWLAAPPARRAASPADTSAQDAATAGNASARSIALAGVALAVAIVVSGVVLARIYSGSPAPAAPAPLGPASSPTAVLPVTSTAPTPAPLVAPSGAPLTVLRTFGAGAGAPLFAQPQEALQGPDGLIYVADTGNHRVAVLDQAGKLIRAITRGPNGALQSPYSLAMTPADHLYVLDSDLGQVLEYAGGKDGGETPLAASPPGLSLGHARGIALEATGDVLVADPASNAVVTLSGDLALVRQQANRAANGADLFEQPDAIAAGPHGSVYVVDSQNNQLKQYSSSWSLLQSWPVAASDTLHAPRVLPLSGGRLLMSDPPDNKLLLFTATSSTPQAFAVTTASGVAGPLGVSRAGPSTVLVTCSGANQVLEVRVPGL